MWPEDKLRRLRAGKTIELSEFEVDGIVMRAHVGRFFWSSDLQAVLVIDDNTHVYPESRVKRMIAL
jgi:hypothetical protein